ncbi:kinase-like domain-containing protein [Mycena sanguinolenta]|nr:kinase-like domain-containing protein [Mycena sanguinolenta]
MATADSLAFVANRFKAMLDGMKDSKDTLDKEIIDMFQSFNVDALASKATEVMHKRRCRSTLPLAQGGYNSVFLIIFDDGADVIARIAKSAYNEPLSDELAKLIATLKYLKQSTSLPVPQVYYSNSDPGEVGARYMIMETMKGMPLELLWPEMSYEQQQDVVTQWAAMQAELLNPPLPFHKIGSLDASGSIGPLAPSSLAPYVLRKPHWGPFDTSQAFLAGYARSTLDGLEENEGQKRCFLQRLLSTIEALPAEKFTGEHFVLHHDDPSAANLLIAHPNKIVGVIDWQGSNILPVWAAFQHPNFLLWTPQEPRLSPILDGGIPVDPLHPVFRELLSLASGSEDLGPLSACLEKLEGGSFAWVTEPLTTFIAAAGSTVAVGSTADSVAEQ